VDKLGMALPVLHSNNPRISETKRAVPETASLKIKGNENYYFNFMTASHQIIKQLHPNPQ
jgi:hypothetical protein